MNIFGGGDSGGGGGGGGSNRLEPTELDNERAALAKERWARWRETGIPARTKFLKRTTGLTVEGGGLRPAGDSRVVDPQGNLRYDATEASVAVEKQIAGAERGIDPNRGGYASLLGAEQARIGAGADTAVRSGTATTENYTRALENATAIGRGQETSNLASRSDIANVASNAAASQLESRLGRKEDTRSLLGTVAGGVAGLKLAEEWRAAR